VSASIRARRYGDVVYLESEAVEAQPVRPGGDPAATLSPELILVSDAETAHAARRALPDPESLDDWIRRLRRNETERAVRALIDETHARRARDERWRRVGAAAFAAACAVVSVLPVLLVVFGA
jgi:hypothetical protein